MQGVDLSKGVQSAVPGWDNVRLLAPHAELKLQACGQSPLIDAHRLRCGACSAVPHFFTLLLGLILLVRAMRLATGHSVLHPGSSLLLPVSDSGPSCSITSDFGAFKGSITDPQRRELRGAGLTRAGRLSAISVLQG